MNRASDGGLTIKGEPKMVPCGAAALPFCPIPQLLSDAPISSLAPSFAKTL
jgi:hypothetical protein